jgi:hypothetical protein
MQPGSDIMQLGNYQKKYINDESQRMGKTLP